MNFNLFKHELKTNVRSLLLWLFGITLLLLGGLSKFEGYAKAGKEAIDELFSALPPQLLTLFGGAAADFTSILTFFGIMFLYLAVLAAIHAALLGANLAAKEELDNTAEFLYPKPLSRREILTSKLLAGITLIAVLNLLTTIISITLCLFYGNGRDISGEVSVMMLGLFFLQMIFLSLGFALASSLPQPKRAVPIVSGVILVTFVLSMAIDLSSNLKDWKIFTPFKYFDGKVVAAEGLEVTYVLLTLIICGLALASAYFFHNKKDLEI